MDALALLCNLHADGPLTLQRLRRLGCESLEGLLELDAAELASELEADPETADRFQREAELLAERLEGSEADDEYVEWGEDTDEEEDEDDQEDADWEELDPLVAEDDHETEELDPAPRVLRTRPETERILATWRDLDRDAPPPEPREEFLPAPAAIATPNRALDEVTLDGLSVDLVERLAEVGVLSLRGLTEASPLELARDIDLSFTRVRRLQFLARRALATLPTEAPEASPFPPAGTPFEASGPFA